MSGSPLVSEAISHVGFDFLVIDMEHVPVGIPELVTILQAVQGSESAPVVRLPWNDMVTVKRAMDIGARSMMVPFVQSVDDATRAVEYTRYPPDGVRGVAAMHRASRFGMVDEYLQKANSEVFLIAQLETRTALHDIEAIVSVKGIDAIFIGPSDLSAFMGLLGDVKSKKVQDAMKWAASQANQANIPIGTIGGTADLVAQYIEYGYDFIACGSDMAMLMSSAKESLAVCQAQRTET